MKKGISPVVASALLLVIAVVAVVSFQGWFQTYSSEIFVKTETDSSQTFQTNIETLIGDQLYFKNNFDENISIKQIKLGNRECNISINISKGVQNISLGDCTDNLTLDSNIGDITVITNKNIYVKKHLFKDISITSTPLSNLNCTLPNGTSVIHGSSFTYYLDSIAFLCQSEIRTCTDGTLSGSYANETCFQDSGNDEYTVLLLQSNTTNGNTIFGDISAGNEKKWIGESNAYFDGSGDYLSIPDSDEWYLTNSDFTIDFWVKFNSLSGHKYILTQGDSSNPQGWDLHYNSDTNGLRFSVGGTARINLPYAFSTGNWYHIALTRNVNTLTFYVNGNSIGSNTYSSSVGNVAHPLWVGRRGDGYYFNGYLDDLRISKGVVRWTSSFVPGTNPLINDSDTSLLLNFDNGHNSVVFDDSSSSNFAVSRFGNTIQKGNHDLTRVGDTIHSTSRSQFGDSSIYFDGTADYISVPSSSDWAMGTGNFTIDFWFNPARYDDNYDTYFTTNNYQVLSMLKRRTGASYGGNLQVYAGVNGENSYNIYDFQPSTLNQWYHAAIVRNNGVVELYINGIKRNVLTSHGDLSRNIVAENLRIGYDGSGTSGQLHGYIDEFRISKGVARWTTNFVPPTQPYR